MRLYLVAYQSHQAEFLGAAIVAAFDRDLKEVAFYSARHHKMLHPNERVIVRDLITGETIAITKPMAVK